LIDRADDIDRPDVFFGVIALLAWLCSGIFTGYWLLLVN
jgi:hypothetical protein